MQTTELIENHLISLELPFERVEESMWVVYDESDHLENLVLYVSGSVLGFRVKLMDLPATAGDAFFRTLLELNASEMVHAAYGIEENAVVIVNTLEIENLDLNELRSTIESIGLAISTHRQILQKHAAAKSDDATTTHA